MNHEYSCGAVVFTKQDGVVRYVLIRSVKGAFGFPKGHMEAGETERETALREIGEEVGLRVTLIDGFRHDTSYLLPDRSDTVKHVAYFLAAYSGQTPTAQPAEVAEIRLLPYEQACRVVTHDGNRVILEHADRFIREHGL